MPAALVMSSDICISPHDGGGDGTTKVLTCFHMAITGRTWLTLQFSQQMLNVSCAKFGKFGRFGVAMAQHSPPSSPTGTGHCATTREWSAKTPRERARI